MWGWVCVCVRAALRACVHACVIVMCALQVHLKIPVQMCLLSDLSSDQLLRGIVFLC